MPTILINASAGIAGLYLRVLIPEQGERTLRRLLIIGASSVVRKAIKYSTPSGSWLARMLARKPRMLVIVALANKMARTVWALQATGEIYRAPVVAA